MSPWLSIVGIGEDGRDGLSLAACTALTQARLVVGGRRHLALAGPLEAETMTWPSPLADAMPRIMARRGTPVCVLASGDPFFYGIGAVLAAAISPEEFICLPAPSSFSLAGARLGWPLQDCRLVSLHGRALERVIPHLQPRAKILALSWDGTTPARLASLLVARGFGSTIVHVLEALGGPRERHVAKRADSIGDQAFDALNILGLAIETSPSARVVPLAPGLPDDWFEHDGQITKSGIRAMTLAALRPFRGAHLWDIGAGSGSIAIEWMLRDPAMRATAIERRPDRAARIARNAAALGVRDVTVITGAAPDVLAGLAAPDAVFIGGGGSDAGLIEKAWEALTSGSRLVVNAVTLETQAALVAQQAARGGELVTIAVSQAEAVGRFRGWRPTMPVVQWSVSKL